MAAAEKRQIVVDLEARNKMGPAARGAADDLGKVGKAAEGAADSAEDLGKASVIAGEGAEKLGKESDQARRHVDQLGNEIRLVEKELIGLAAAFAAANTAAERLDISKGIRKSQAELRRLKTSKGLLEGILPDPVPVAKTFMQKLGPALASASAEVSAASGPIGMALGAGIGLAAAPTLLTSLATAISAGAGAGVIGVGIAAAVAKDKDIQAAGAALGKNFIQGFQASATKNFGGPIRQSLTLLATEGDRIVKSWDTAFASLSSSIVPLTSDIVHGIDRINDAVVGIAKTSGPALDALGDSWLLLSDGVGDALEAMAGGSEEAGDGLVLLVGLTSDLIRTTGQLIGTFTELSSNEWISGPLLPLLTKGYRDAAADSITFVDATQDVVGALTAEQRAAAGSVKALSDLNTELRAQADPVFALREAQLKLTDAQHASAKAIEKHGKNSKEAKEATRDMAKAALDLQGAAGKLGDDFNGKLTPAMRATLKAAGLTKGQINDVEKEFGAARKAGNAFAKTYASNVKVNGAPAARRLLYSVKEIIDGIPRAVTIGMRITGVSNVSAAAAAIRKNTRASGGPVKPGVPYWVGEEGPELIMPMAAGTVINATKSRQMTGRPVGYGGGPHMAGYGAAQSAWAHSLTGPAVPTVRVDVTGAEGKFKAWIRELYKTGQLP